MAAPSVQIRVQGDGKGGSTGASTRSVLRKSSRLRNSRVGNSRYGDPSTNASIPSRYQAFFYTSSEARGFNAQATRFQNQLNVNDTPGPGTYSTPIFSLNTHSTSASKAGRGAFASKSSRFRRERRRDLGPGSYNPSLPPTRHDFSSSTVNSFFQSPIAVKPADGEAPRCPSPSPTTYHPSHTHTEHNHLITGQAAFKSRIGRSALPPSSSHAPSPGHYHVRDDLLHPRPSPHSSVFTSKSRREGILKSSKGPGPADYTPHNPHSNSAAPTSHPPATSYHRQKHYLRLSAPAMPLPPLPPSPGPGHYETQAPSDTDKKKPSACGFSSKTDRWRSEVTSGKDSPPPGPGSYDPIPPLRRSYFYNTQRKWTV